MKKVPLIHESKLELYVANIKSCYYQALQYPTIAECGLNWYFDAKTSVIKLATRYHTSIEVACGVIAALSPNNKWERNLVDADLLLRHWKIGDKLESFKVATYNHNKDKAWQIAHGVDPLEALRGNKTRAFYQCLFLPTNSFAVCIDSHAINIALGKSQTIAQTPTLNSANYEILARAYKLATQEINRESLESSILPLQVQAVTWTLYRVLRGIDSTYTI